MFSSKDKPSGMSEEEAAKLPRVEGQNPFASMFGGVLNLGQGPNVLGATEIKATHEEVAEAGGIENFIRKKIEESGGIEALLSSGGAFQLGTTGLQGSQGPQMSFETPAQSVEILRGYFEGYGRRRNPFKPGDVVTPREGGIVMGHGKACLVVEVGSWFDEQNRTVDMKVARRVMSPEGVKSVWSYAESVDFELFQGDVR